MKVNKLQNDLCVKDVRKNTSMHWMQGTTNKN